MDRFHRINKGGSRDESIYSKTFLDLSQWFPPWRGARFRRTLPRDQGTDWF